MNFFVAEIMTSFTESVQSELNFLPLNFSFSEHKSLIKDLEYCSLFIGMYRVCFHYQQLGTTLFNVHACAANIFLQNKRSARLVRHMVHFLLQFYNKPEALDLGHVGKLNHMSYQPRRTLILQKIICSIIGNCKVVP